MLFRLVALLTTVGLPGTLEALSKRHVSLEEADAHDGAALLQLSAVPSAVTQPSAQRPAPRRPAAAMLQVSQDLAQCRLLLPILEKSVKSNGKLEGLCRKAFPVAACQQARRALSTRPWSGKAVGTACSQLEAAGSWQSRVRLEPLLLRRSGKDTLSLAELQGSARVRLETTLKWKAEEQDEVPEPPYSHQDPAVPSITYYGEPAEPLKPNDETYVDGLGTKVNADWEDTQKWCGQNAKGDLTLASDCPPQVVAPAATSEDVAAASGVTENGNLEAESEGSTAETETTDAAESSEDTSDAQSSSTVDSESSTDDSKSTSS